MTKPKIIIFLSHYLPGYKSGGPVRTIENLINNLHNDFDFYVITSDRDLGDSQPYKDIKVNQWNKIGNAQVYYIDKKSQSINFYKRFLSVNHFDLIYFNSFFNANFTIKPLIALKKLREAPPILLAPKGEFSTGALQLKSFKKHVYIKLSQWLYKGIYFHASSEYEKNDILKVFPNFNKEKILTAIDLPQKSNFIPQNKNENKSDTVKLIFLSRISPKKNLDYALQVLMGIKHPIAYSIYGPIEDRAYWDKCQELIKQLPPNVSCSYKGVVEPHNIQTIFSQYDLFFFPTKGENYGHVIAESLSAGTPVLISDQTPWRNLESHAVGWDLNLNNPQEFVDKINEFITETSKFHNKMDIIHRSSPLLINQADIDANKQMFLEIIEG